MANVTLILTAVMGFLRGIGEVFRFANTLTDPAKRREAYELKLDKMAKKALEYGEKEFFLVDEFLAKQISEARLRDFHKRYRRIFFKND